MWSESNANAHTQDLSSICQGEEGSEHMLPIAAALEHNCTLLHLNIQGNFIADSEADAIAKVLEKNHTLKYLDMSENSLVDGLGSLCSTLLCKNTCLLVLKLGTLLGHSDPRDMANVLRQNSTLQRLDLCNGDMGDVRCAQVIRGLQASSRLRSIDMSGNWCACKSILALAKALETNTSLIHADISSLHGIKAYDDESLIEIGKALQYFPRYHEINIQGVDLSKVAASLGLRALARGEPWTHGSVLAHIRLVNLSKIIAFAMGGHTRLGASSSVRYLSLDCINAVVLKYFGLPVAVNFSEVKNGMLEYLDVMEALK
jgi:Ran GTPase-activating protein (RanGAP) involved in mRNA processing and transport